MSPSSSYLSESGRLFRKKNHRQEHFSVKHGGSVAATARQQTYCASNLEHGGVEIPALLVLY